MIGSLRGKLVFKTPDNVLIDVNGVGYVVSVPVNMLSGLPAEGSEVSLMIYTHVREESIQLFGFPSEHERRVFATLLGISGVGPKMALNILSAMPYDDFLSAVQNEDVALLCRVPGLGRKTAQRLILELREKLPSSRAGKDSVFEDALSALVNLGYKKALAQEFLEKSYQKGSRDIESLLRETLKQLTGHSG